MNEAPHHDGSSRWRVIERRRDRSWFEELLGRCLDARIERNRRDLAVGLVEWIQLDLHMIIVIERVSATHAVDSS